MNTKQVTKQIAIVRRDGETKIYATAAGLKALAGFAVWTVDESPYGGMEAIGVDLESWAELPPESKVAIKEAR